MNASPESGQSSELEGLLQRALAPVDPPEGLDGRLERHLAGVAQAAADELADWELAAMRDPRNWVRPVVAVAAGSVAAGALVILGARSRRRPSTRKRVQDAAQGARDRLPLG